MALRILLADDSMTAQNMAKKILVDAGYEVIAVSNGAAAMKRIAADRPDLVILDVYMPGYAGDEVCDRVKSSPDTAHIPVLLTVGKMEPFNPEKARKARADGLMIKPFEATDLIAAVQNIGNKKSGQKLGPAKTEAATQDVEDEGSGANGAEEHDQTVRLTPEQIHAAQDQTFKDWLSRPQPGNEEAATPAIPEFSATPFIQPEQSTGSAEPFFASSASVLEPAPQVHPERDAFTVVPTSPAASFELPSELSTSDVPAFSSELPSFVVSNASSAQASAPVVEEQPSAWDSTLSLETNEPILTEGEIVAPTPEIVAESAPEVPEPATETTPELEINSPIHHQPEVHVDADPALVTSDEELSQFTTKIGQENPEEVHVGILTDLPSDWVAALTVPKEEFQETIESVPQFAGVPITPVVPLEEPGPVLPEAVALPEEPSTLVEQVPETHRTTVLDEIGTMETKSPMNGTGPVVAYVPSMDYTLPVPAYVQPEPVPITPETPAAAEAEPEPVAEESVAVPVALPVTEIAAAVTVGGMIARATELYHAERKSGGDSVFSRAVATAIEEEHPEPPAEHAQATEISVPQTEAHAEQAFAVAAAPVAGAATHAEKINEDADTEDEKLSAAVSRALEHLKPKIIAEILKELSK